VPDDAVVDDESVRMCAYILHLIQLLGRPTELHIRRGDETLMVRVFLPAWDMLDWVAGLYDIDVTPALVEVLAGAWAEYIAEVLRG
jgi:hypothetical protein